MTAVPVGPPPAPTLTTDVTTTATAPGTPGAKPTSDDPKVRVKQIHPAAAKAMKHVMTPPVLSAIGLSIVGLVVLVWVTVGWVAAVGLIVLAIVAVFSGALAWKRAGVRKAAARARQGGKAADRAARRSLLDVLRRRNRQAARTNGPAAGSGGAGAGPAGGPRAARGGLLGRLRQRFGRRPGGTGQAAHGSPSGGGPAGHKGTHRAPGGMRSKFAGLFRRKPGGGGGSPATHSSGGHGTPGGKPGSRQRGGFRLPNIFRRKSGGGSRKPGGGGGSPAAPGDGHKPTRRGRRGGKGRNNGNSSGGGGNSGGSTGKKPGFLRRTYNNYRHGIEQGAKDVENVGVPKKKPNEQNGQQAAAQRPPQKQRQPRTTPSSVFPGAVDLLEPGKCAQCGGPILKGEFAYPAKGGGLVCPGCGLQPGFARPQSPLPKKPAAHNAASTTNRTTAPASGASNGRNTTMGINPREDQSLFAYLRTLAGLSPVIGETANRVGTTQSQVAALAEGIKKMAVHGDSEQPASKKIVASVEALATKVAGYAAEMEQLVGKLRQAEAEAEALKAEGDREHETDHGRMQGERGGIDKEIRADVSRGIQDT